MSETEQTIIPIMEQAVPTVDKETQEQELRKYARLSLRDDDAAVDLALACDGVTVKLRQKNWWKISQIGIANIKDFGLGGVGLITSTPLEIGQEVIIELNGHEMAVEIARSRPINSKLNFVGARWLSTDDKTILSMINQIKPT
ncbi:pilus assembly protein PilZ [Shewanella surugensis]|uniref:Pilus assembly protein PilZ n=1 Tax=Shewanella surugensis TaxID=212020 RepID=A0ABT0LFR6_9GAMM|nr:pilus assembly protein PilZ [Shewanella surugensis]MCL1126500.1 pilus assembly protein PilZ [Shewanella surugensis]